MTVRLSQAQIEGVQRELERLGAQCVVAYQRKRQGRWFKLSGPMASFRDALAIAEAPPEVAVHVAVGLRHDKLGGIAVWSSETPDRVIRLPGGARIPPLEPPPTEKELSDAIYEAGRAAFQRLFSERRSERFYYCTLTTTGEGSRPAISAWSHEALAAVPEAEREQLAWSYADSPYCCFGDEHFARVEALFARRPQMDPWSSEEERNAEYELRLRAMESAMARLDAEGLFGRGAERLGMVVAVEVMPPDWTNRARVERLNPPEAIRYWLEHVAEPEPGNDGS